SRDVGFALTRKFATRYPKPCITEMGGKNPAIVTSSADLDLAAEGVLKSAFGLQGQKCSACSRIYVDRKVAKEFTERLVEKTKAITIGDPAKKENWMGPVINRSAHEKFAEYVEHGRRDGKVLAGGQQLKDEPHAHGFFVQPTLIGGLPKDHLLSQEE